MFFLYNFFQDGDALNPSASNMTINTLEITNGIFDHLTLLSAISGIYSDSYAIPPKPDDWNKNTVLNVNFNNTLDGGSISQFIGNVDYLAIQRREEGSNEWITLKKIYKNTADNSIITQFTMDDTYNQDGIKYVYQIVPVDTNGNTGTAIQQEVVSHFNGAFIADASHIYDITTEYQKDRQKNQKSAIYEPYGSRFPFVAYNAETNYDSGTVTAVLLAPTSKSETSSYLDRRAQTKLIEEFNNWLSNGKPKILKDFNGDFKIVTITNNVANAFYKELGNGLASVSFNYTEVGLMQQKYLDNLGMSNIPIHEK